jgi:hypothetical protein
MAENENESDESENDNSKKIEITDQDIKNYLSDKVDVHPLPGETRKNTTAEMLNDAEKNHI